MRTVNSPFDTIIKLRNSVIQHGPSSNRIYLMKLKPEDYPDIIPELTTMAETHQYGKIFAKVPSHCLAGFLEHGFEKEAVVPGYYAGEDDAIFLGKYVRKERRNVSDEARSAMEQVIAVAGEKSTERSDDLGFPPFSMRQLRPDDAEALTRLYGAVFASYPFPIFEREYIVHTMEEDSIAYYGAFADNSRLIAASSAELNKEARNAEMTDFATHPDARGHNIALHLLRLMEEDMRDREMHVLYTIARAISTGMNVTFAKAGYEYTGTLINNTNIAGQIENMNVWFKTMR